MRWTPQAHYQVSTDGQGTAQGKGFWENAQPEPDPEPEPAGPDAKSWKTSNDVPTVTASAAEAVAAAVKAHAELASRLEVADLLEGADGADSIVWKLPGLEQTAPAALPTGLCTFRCVSAVFDQLGTQWRLCTQTDASDGSHGSLAVFLQIVGEAISEPVAFALRVVAEDDDTILAEHIVESHDFQVPQTGWGKLRLHPSLAQIHDVAAQGVISVRLLWLRTASTPLPAGAQPALIATASSTAAVAAAGTAEGQPQIGLEAGRAKLPEGTPERRARRTQTVCLAKASVGFGMNIDTRGVIVAVIPGSPAFDNGVPTGCKIIGVHGVRCDGKPEIVAQLSQPEVTAIAASPGVQFELELELEAELEDGHRDRDPAVRLAKAAAGGGGKALGKVKAFGKGRRGSLPDSQ